MTPDAREQARHKASVTEWENLGHDDVIRKGDEVSHFGSDGWIPAVDSIGRKFSVIDAESGPFKARRRVKPEERKPLMGAMWKHPNYSHLCSHHGCSDDEAAEINGWIFVTVMEVLPSENTGKGEE